MTRAKTLWLGKGNNSSEFPRRKHTPETENNQLFSPSWPPVQYVPFSISLWRKPTRQERHQKEKSTKRNQSSQEKKWRWADRKRGETNIYYKHVHEWKRRSIIDCKLKNVLTLLRRERRERERGAEANLVRHICLGHVIMVKLNTSLIDQISTRFFSSWARKRTFATLCRRGERELLLLSCRYMIDAKCCGSLLCISLRQAQQRKKKDHSACICKKKMCILTKRITDLIQTKDNICNRRKRLVLWYGWENVEQIMWM